MLTNRIDDMKIKFVLLFVMFLAFVQASAASFPDVIDKTKKSIVAVGTYMQKRSPRGVFLGTGFAIGDGSLIVTNEHVLAKNIDKKNLEAISVFFKQNGQVQMQHVEIVARDKKHDLAILKLLSGTLPALQLSEKKTREGQSIAFTGYPIGMVLGLYPVTHTGIVSAISPVAIPMLKSRQLNAKLLKRLREPYDVYQLDATAYPGNSGSPMYDKETGQVIGIINKVFIKESKESILAKPSGITYAIPIKYLNELLKREQLK